MSPAPATDTEKYGWTAVPRDVKLLLAQSEEYKSGPAPALLVSDPQLALPESKLVTDVLAYATKELPVETLHHSMRVWCYGQAILAYAFPSWKSPSFDETYLLSSLLHDIGTTDTHTATTRMSFEFHGGILSLSLLQSLGAATAQAENVAETVMRHQDLGSTGKLTRIAALVQLATIFDNMGGNPEVVSLRTVESVVQRWPRRGWSACFAGTVRREMEVKPWAHTTHLGEREFPEGVEGNALMAPYDG